VIYIEKTKIMMSKIMMMWKEGEKKEREMEMGE